MIVFFLLSCHLVFLSLYLLFLRKFFRKTVTGNYFKYSMTYYDVYHTHILYNTHVVACLGHRTSTSKKTFFSSAKLSFVLQAREFGVFDASKEGNPGTSSMAVVEESNIVEKSRFASVEGIRGSLEKQKHKGHNGYVFF